MFGQHDRIKVQDEVQLFPWQKSVRKDELLFVVGNGRDEQCVARENPDIEVPFIITDAARHGGSIDDMGIRYRHLPGIQYAAKNPDRFAFNFLRDC
jgi:hypothetical protein